MGFITSRTNLAGLSENELKLVNELLMDWGGTKSVSVPRQKHSAAFKLTCSVCEPQPQFQ